MSEVEQQITVAIKTFERPELVNRAVSSLRQFHPTMPVIIADDSKEPISFNDDPYTETLHLPFDTGISYGRNRAIERVKTPFYLLMDDDYFFNADCNLEGLVKTLETTDFDIISMRVLNYREKKGGTAEVSYILLAQWSEKVPKWYITLEKIVEFTKVIHALILFIIVT